MNTIEKLFEFQILDRGTPLPLITTFLRQTWPCAVYNFGPASQQGYVLCVKVLDPSQEYHVFQRDFWAQAEGGSGSAEVWRTIEANTNLGGFTTPVTIADGITGANTNNLQVCFLLGQSFFNIMVTVQVGRDGNLYLICQKTWHGQIFRDEHGEIRVPDLERKEQHPLNRLIIEQYADDDLPLLPEDYTLWAEKIRFRELKETDVVVIAMDDGLNGGTYYCRNRRGKYQKVTAQQLRSQECPFPTVGTILSRRGSDWTVYSDVECQDIFFGPLDFRREKGAETLLYDLRGVPIGSESSDAQGMEELEAALNMDITGSSLA